MRKNPDFIIWIHKMTFLGLLAGKVFLSRFQINWGDFIPDDKSIEKYESWTDLEKDNKYMKKVQAELNQEWIRSNFIRSLIPMTGPSLR